MYRKAATTLRTLSDVEVSVICVMDVCEIYVTSLSIRVSPDPKDNKLVSMIFSVCSMWAPLVLYDYLSSRLQYFYIYSMQRKESGDVLFTR